MNRRAEHDIRQRTRKKYSAEESLFGYTFP